MGSEMCIRDRWLAVMADRIIKGSGVYRTLLVWPYAVAPAVAGILWLFMFSPGIGLITWYLDQIGVDWNHSLNSGQATGLVVVASAWGRISYNFLFFLAAFRQCRAVSSRQLPLMVLVTGVAFGPSYFHCCRQRRFFY